jgi:hypothetical protein
MYFQDISTTIMIHVYDFNLYFPVIMLHNTETMQVHGGKFSLQIYKATADRSVPQAESK